MCIASDAYNSGDVNETARLNLESCGGILSKNIFQVRTQSGTSGVQAKPLRLDLTFVSKTTLGSCYHIDD